MKRIYGIRRPRATWLGAALLAVVLYPVSCPVSAMVYTSCDYHLLPGADPSAFGPYTSLTISPANPNSNQTIDIAVGYRELGPVSVAKQIQGNVINVTVAATEFFNDLGVPGACMSTTVGPLSPGTYTVNYYLIDFTLISLDPAYAAPQYLQSTQFSVVPAAGLLSCSTPSQNTPACNSAAGCIFVCPQPAVSSAKVDLLIALPQLPAGACASDKLATAVSNDAIQITGSYTRCPAGTVPPSVTYISASLEPLPARTYPLSVVMAPDANYGKQQDPFVVSSVIDVLPSTSTQPNFQGLWWAAPAGSESGWGFNLAHQGPLIFMSWFTFDVDGVAHWYVATLRESYGNFADFGGPLYDVTGPSFDRIPFPPIGMPGGATGAKVGGISLYFRDADSGLLIPTFDDGMQRDIPVVRQVFGRAPNCTWGVETDLSLAPNYTDLWWASPPGSEAGWGINLTHQDDIVFATWFTFDHNRSPMWLAVQANKTAPGTYTGILLKAISGPVLFSKPFPPLGTPGGPIAETVGTATFVFSDGNAATFTYTVNGVTQTKSITREVFVGPGTVCQ